MRNDAAIERLREKLAFMEAELARTDSAGKKFDIQQELREARAKLAQLETEQKSGPGEPPPAVPKIAPSRLRVRDTGIFKGREKELDALDAAWSRNAGVWQESFNRNADENEKLTGPAVVPHVIVMRAVGGAGKSTLAARWKANLLARGDHGGIERYFDWSFYSQGTSSDSAGVRASATSDEFFTAAFDFFGETAGALEKDAWKKGAHLAELIAGHRTLLLLDGVEPLQHPPGTEGGYLKEEPLKALLNSLAQNSPGLCLVTTRERVADLATWRDTTAPEWRLDALSHVAGAEVLRALGVTGPQEELERASREVKGHALTLSLMGRYLKAAFGDNPDIARRDCFQFTEADAETLNGHALRVIAAYERWLESEDRRVELTILRLLGLFARPAEPDCLSALRQPPAIPGLTDALTGVPDAKWNIAVTNLEELDLVQTLPWEAKKIRGYNKGPAKLALVAGAQDRSFRLGQPKLFLNYKMRVTSRLTLDSHPLLREYFAKRLHDTVPDSLRAGHERLCEYLCASVPYWPEGADGLQPLYQAVAHGCLAGRYEQTLTDIFINRIGRGSEAYSLKKLGLLGADLAALACFFVEPWRRPTHFLGPTHQAWLLSDAAFRLRVLNRPNEAREPTRAGMELWVKEEQWQQAARGAANLIELELLLGEVATAVDTAAQSVVLADRSGLAFEKMAARIYHAAALHQAGREKDIGNSRRVFAEAEAIQGKTQPEFPLMYSGAGFRYCDLLLSESERTAWRVFDMGYIVRTGATTSNPARGDEGIAACLEVIRSIEQRATLALTIAERTPNPLDIALNHLTLGHAWLYRVVFEPATPLSSARTHLEEALTILRHVERHDHRPRVLLTRAWLHVLEREMQQAHNLLSEAQALAERGGMKLFLADVHLHRARLFREKTELPRARSLIEQTGYLRRLPELEAAEAAAESW